LAVQGAAHSRRSNQRAVRHFRGASQGTWASGDVGPDHRCLDHRCAASAQRRGREGGHQEGRIPDGWAAKPKKLAQKDRDARWTLKRAKARPQSQDGTITTPRVEIAILAFGYKNHVSIDRAHGFVRRFAVTDAATYDGGQLANLLDKDNTASTVWADTAYRSKRNERHIARNGFFSKVHFRRKPGFDLTPSQMTANAARSKIRSAVETVFAAQKHRFGLFVRTIGLARATVKIGLANLTYNMRRLVWIEQRNARA